MKNPPPPTPKYNLGEYVVFNRKGTDSAQDGDATTDMIEKITAIDMILDKAGWTVRYYFSEADGDCPESCVKGSAIFKT